MSGWSGFVDAAGPLLILLTGSRAPDYEAGLLPGATYGGDRVRSSGCVRPSPNPLASAG